MGYEAISEPVRAECIEDELSFTPNIAYEQYLKMHKVFVGKVGAGRLESIFEDLHNEHMPRYLCAAGWAAVEAAIVHKDLPTIRRLELIDSGIDCWERAIDVQRRFNEFTDDHEHLVEHSTPYRMAIDLAVTPILRGLVLGEVTEQTCRDSFADCLAISEANYVQLELAVSEGNFEAANDHLGFAYECNALLALNRVHSKSWFAIPAMARSDSGYYHPEQTHDLLVIRSKGDEIKNVIPVEIKASASLKDRRRYQALLVRGKMHLSIEGHHAPRTTLEAISAVYNGTADSKQEGIAHTVSQKFMKMLNDYYEGEELESASAGSELTIFRNKSLVSSRHPGLSTEPIL